jgi:hypothetical protein
MPSRTLVEGIRSRHFLPQHEIGQVNGYYYDCTCFHPLFVLFNQFGDLERCALRPGNVHSADGWEAF